jgi:hypothetical protein
MKAQLSHLNLYSLQNRNEGICKAAVGIGTFEKRSILPAQLNLYLIFNRGSSSRNTKRLTTGIKFKRFGKHSYMYGLDRYRLMQQKAQILADSFKT